MRRGVLHVGRGNLEAFPDAFLTLIPLLDRTADGVDPRVVCECVVRCVLVADQHAVLARVQQKHTTSAGCETNAAFPPGSMCGRVQEPRSSLTATSWGTPPVPRIVVGRRPSSAANRIVPSVPQLPPYGLAAVKRSVGAPPETATFLSLLLAKKPIQRPSGEKKGPNAPSVCWIGAGSSWSERVGTGVER